MHRNAGAETAHHPPCQTRVSTMWDTDAEALRGSGRDWHADYDDYGDDGSAAGTAQGSTPLDDVDRCLERLAACPLHVTRTQAFAVQAGLLFGRMVAMDSRDSAKNAQDMQDGQRLHENREKMRRVQQLCSHWTIFDPAACALLLTLIKPEVLYALIIFWPGHLPDSRPFFAAVLLGCYLEQMEGTDFLGQNIASMLLWLSASLIAVLPAGLIPAWQSAQAAEAARVAQQTLPAQTGAAGPESGQAAQAADRTSAGDRGRQEQGAAGATQSRGEQAHGDQLSDTQPREDPFEESLKELLPLAPEEVERFLRARDALEGAAEPGPARMQSRVRTLDAGSISTGEVLHLTRGYSSTVLVEDVTGAPWPVLSAILGDPGAFAVSQPRADQEVLPSDGASSSEGRGEGAKERSVRNVHSHIVNIVPLTNHAVSNLVLTLEGAQYPLVLHLVTDSARRPGRASDALTVLRLSRPGPCARAVAVGPAPGMVSEAMLGFMHGRAPAGAVRMKVQPADQGLQVWLYEGSIYVRSMHQAVWPAWTQTAATEGWTLYVMPRTPSLVLTREGRRVRYLLSAPAFREQH